MKEKKPDEYMECANCKNKIKPNWEYLTNLKGWIGGIECDECHELNIYVDGSDEFKDDILKKIDEHPDFISSPFLKH